MDMLYSTTLIFGISATHDYQLEYHHFSLS